MKYNFFHNISWMKCFFFFFKSTSFGILYSSLLRFSLRLKFYRWGACTSICKKGSSQFCTGFSIALC